MRPAFLSPAKRLGRQTFATAIILAACLIGLTSCGRKETQPAPTGNPDAPYAFSTRDRAASVQFRFPDSAPEHAQIRDRLAQEARTLFAETSRGCEIAHTEAQREALEFRPCTIAVSWRETASAGTIVSYEGAILLATGGAHPNLARKSLVWDLARGEKVDFADLFADSNAPNALKERLCSTLRGAKAERLKRAGLDPAEPFECPDPTVLPITLAPAETPGTFAGIFFLIEPYVIGPYSEGPYDAFLPEADLHQLLAAEWQPRFHGAPVPGQIPGPDGLPVTVPDFTENAGQS